MGGEPRMPRGGRLWMGASALAPSRQPAMPIPMRLSSRLRLQNLYFKTPLCGVSEIGHDGFARIRNRYIEICRYDN